MQEVDLMTRSCSTNEERQRAKFAHRRSRPILLLIGALACCGCQAALPGGFVWSEDARIEKKAKADAFPSPADVGLTEPTSVP